MFLDPLFIFWYLLCSLGSEEFSYTNGNAGGRPPTGLVLLRWRRRCIRTCSWLPSMFRISSQAKLGRREGGMRALLCSLGAKYSGRESNLFALS